MTEFPINKPVTLRYLPELPKDIPLAGELGGMYATALDGAKAVEVEPISPKYPEQTWFFSPSGRGFSIQLYQDWPKIAGIPPVGLGAAWFNSSPEPGTPITLTNPNEPSIYHLNLVTRFEDGWIISIVPMGELFGLNRFIGVSGGKTVEILGEPILFPTPFPGWYVKEVDVNKAS